MTAWTLVVGDCGFLTWIFIGCVYVYATLGTLRHIALSKHIQTYCSEDYVQIKYESVNVKPNKYVFNK